MKIPLFYIIEKSGEAIVSMPGKRKNGVNCLKNAVFGGEV